MEEVRSEGSKAFETDHAYAIVAGWLILPALKIISAFVLLLVSIDFNNLLGTWSLVWLYIPFLMIIMVAWVQRKKVLPQLAIAYFASIVLLNIFTALSSGQMQAGWGSLLFDLVWIGYFIRSKRVKETFIR